MLLSETYELYDTIFYDTGLPDTASSSITTVRCDTKPTNTGREVTATGNAAHAILKQNNRVFDLPFMIEFTVTALNLGTDGGAAIDVYDGVSEYKIWLDTTGYYKIKVDTINGAVAQTGSESIGISGNKPTTTSRISINLAKTDDTITITNLMIY